MCRVVKGKRKSSPHERVIRTLPFTHHYPAHSINPQVTALIIFSTLHTYMSPMSLLNRIPVTTVAIAWHGDPASNVNDDIPDRHRIFFD